MPAARGQLLHLPVWPEAVGAHRELVVGGHIDRLAHVAPCAVMMAHYMLHPYNLHCHRAILSWFVTPAYPPLSLLGAITGGYCISWRNSANVKIQAVYDLSERFKVSLIRDGIPRAVHLIAKL